ncbi:MAG: hypothetical protein J6U67_08630, partial [Lachnospiraceae bacterium]|nr:hypothetical protein [Lachnospiraceae bacterium]
MKKLNMSRRTKKTVRRSVAGVLMVTSIIVAAVPAKPTEAYIAPGTGTGENAETTYVYGVQETDSTDLAYYDPSLTGVNLNRYGTEAGYGLGGDTDEANVKKTYMVRQLSDGSFDYNWQFKVYQQNVNGSPYAIVCKYNDTYASGTVSIEASIPLSYCAVEKDFFDNYLGLHTAAKVPDAPGQEKVKKYLSSVPAANASDPAYTAADVHTQTKFVMENIDSTREDNNLEDDYWIKRYFPTQYAAYKTKYEDWVSDKSKFDAFVIDMAKYNTDKAEYDIQNTAYQHYIDDPDNYPKVDKPTAPTLPDKPTYSTSNAYPAAAQTNVGTPVSQSVADPTSYCPYLTCWVADMPRTKEGMYSYFCEVHPSYFGILQGHGYSLDEVKDSRGGTSGLTNQYVYMPKGTANESFSSSSRNDAYGFRITELTSVIGIGAHAFESTTNVTELNLAGEV